MRWCEHYNQYKFKGDWKHWYFESLVTFEWLYLIFFSLSGVSQESVWLWVNSQRQWMEVGVSGVRGLTVPGPVGLELSQQRENVTTPSKSDLLTADWIEFVARSIMKNQFPTDQSLEASTAPGKESVIGRATPNPVRRTSPRFGRCCAASSTLCLITMRSTSGFLLPTLVSRQKV